MKKLQTRWLAKSILKRLLDPRHIIRYLRLSPKKQALSRSHFDTQLKLYSQILPGDFLHYGYFDDPGLAPEKISLYDIQQAQLRYAELILEQIYDHENEVLDVGCGTGGLINLLLRDGYQVVGLTPDRFQIQYISEKYPQAKLIQSKFQKIEMNTYENHFGTIINAESLQYINLEKAIEIIQRILKKKGRWIVVDYFRTKQSMEKSGHFWEEFLLKIKTADFRIIHEQDISRNIRPTLAYVYLWGEKLGLPLFDFLIGKFKKKHPKLVYILDDAIKELNSSLQQKLDIVNPDIFMHDKKYMLLCLEKCR